MNFYRQWIRIDLVCFVSCQFIELCFLLQINNSEMVSLARQPDNQYDDNAVKVSNVMGDQVGHIKKELARPLAYIMDQKLARLEG